MPFNFPILLSWLRVAMIPLVVGVFYVPDSWMALPAKNLTA
ncbi:CDP-diacylglycerol--glycerol-3-phosphate 3-phosphatidyltransferase, partial [Escherichia coli]|nr:CDP-diacylglycerol--glycerol-3-phosphate 3-phosphatidyltransferase [Escherichia coli]